MAKAESIIDQIMDLVEEMIERDPEYGDALLAMLQGEATQENLYVLVGLPCDNSDTLEPEPEPVRRGRGRPPAAEVDDPPVRRGRGRQVEAEEEEEETEVASAPARRGRPPAAAPAPVRGRRR